MQLVDGRQEGGEGQQPMEKGRVGGAAEESSEADMG